MTPTAGEEAIGDARRSARRYARRVAGFPWPARVRRSRAAKRAAALVIGPTGPRFGLSRAPERPVGAKLELTFACNLRCGFCYTDSPRHTLARTPELGDEDWDRVLAEVIDLGVLEAVVTGGEPLLRRELALGALERLDDAGVATYLNTNGWFVDDAVADRLGPLAGLHVFISVDGATAARHDSARGVPGSWKRAIDGVSRLLDRGVPTRIVHVVTPDNLAEVPAALELFWTLGVPSVHLAPVAPIGAAARDGDWKVDLAGLADVVDDALVRFGPGMGVELRGGDTDTFDPLATAPATFLVRPDGIVRINSSVPFSFGHVEDGGVEGCWERLRAGWDGPDVRRWLNAVQRRSQLGGADVVPYLDADAPAGGAGPASAPGGRGSLHPPAATARNPELTTLREALAHVREHALGRRYRLGPVRWTAAGPGERFVRHRGTGVVTLLNASAAAVMEGCAEGTPGDALALLRRRHPHVATETLERDVLDGVRLLLARGIALPAAAVGTAASGEPVPAAALTA